MTSAVPVPRSLAFAGLSLLVTICAPALARTRVAEPAAGPRDRVVTAWPQKAKGPILLAVSLADQRMTVWDNGVVVARSPVSTGVAGHETPRGAFTVLQKRPMHRSNIYSSAPMPYMQRITWSGVALHQGHVTGRPASHGCIRLPADIAKRLYGITRIGARVIITDQPVAPADFAHPKLFSAAAPEPSALAPAPVRLASLHPAAMDLAKAEPILPAATPEPKPEPEHRTQSPKAPREPSGHVSVFISGKERKLFMRQGFEPIYESPVEIRAGGALGAHLFTAMEVERASGAVRWSRVSLPVAGAHASEAAEALERIDIPEEARLEVGRRLSAGASLLIADQGLGRETGKTATDFILLTP